MVDKVTWHSAHGMRAGTVTLSFEAVAVTSGVFVRPPAQALIEMQPEVMGFSAGGLFEVSRTTLTAEQMALPVTPPPIDCPGDGCSGNGVCDVVSGACVCSGDFVGDDCAETSAPLALDILSQRRERGRRGCRRTMRIGWRPCRVMRGSWRRPRLSSSAGIAAPS